MPSNLNFNPSGKILSQASTTVREAKEDLFPEESGLQHLLRKIGDAGDASLGRETSEQKRSRENMEFEMFNITKNKAAFEMLQGFQKMMGQAGPDSAPALAKYFAQTVDPKSEMFGGGVEKFLIDSVSNKDSQALIKSFTDAPELYATAFDLSKPEDMQQAIKIATTPELRDAFEWQAVRKNIPDVNDKIKNIKKRIDANDFPEELRANYQNPDGSKKDVSEWDFYSLMKYLPEDERLSGLELTAVDRYPSLFDSNGIASKTTLSKTDGSEFQTDEYDRGLKVIAAGGNLTNLSFSEPVKNALKDVSQSQATARLQAGKKEGFTIETTPEGRTIIK